MPLPKIYLTGIIKMQKNNYNTIAETPNSTVVAEYISAQKKTTDYQSENELERDLIRQLSGNGITHLSITKNDDLLNNLRHQLELLNEVCFSEKEWGKGRIFVSHLRPSFYPKEHKPNASVH